MPHQQAHPRVERARAQEPPTHERARRERGAASVELAIVLALFLTIVFGIVDFGLALRSAVVVNNATREGARLAVVQPDETAIIDRVRAVTASLNQSTLNVKVSCVRPDKSSCPGGVKGADTGDTVVVAATYSHNLVTPLSGFMGNMKKIDLSSETIMRVE